MEQTAKTGIYPRNPDHCGVYRHFRQLIAPTFAQNLLDILQPLGCKTALDAACGDGILAVALAERGMSVQAADASPDTISAAEKLSAERGVTVDFARQDVRELHHHYNNMDAVICMNSEIARFQEGAPLRGALESIYSCLRPGEAAVFQTENFEMMMDTEEHKPFHMVRTTGMEMDANRCSIVEVGHFPVEGVSLHCKYIYIVEEIASGAWFDESNEVEYAPLESKTFEGYLEEAGFTDIQATEEPMTTTYVCRK